MYDSKFKKMMSDYATKTGKSVDALTEEDYSKIIYETAGQSFIDECLLLERKELLNPMFKRAQDILFKAYLSTDEEKVKELEEIINTLESGEIDLDDSINKYTEAMKLVKECDEELKKVEEKISKIALEDGRLEDFEVDTTK